MRDLADVRRELGVEGEGPLLLDEYQAYARLTYRGHLQGADRFDFLLLGLYGEVGSLLSELKKKQRDRGAYTAYASSAVEETGDVLWYLANVADAAGHSLADLAVACGRLSIGGAARTIAELESQAALFEEPASNAAVQRSLLRLAARTGRVVRRAQEEGERSSELGGDLAAVLDSLVAAAEQGHVRLEHAATDNLVKLLDRWPVRRTFGDLYDGHFHSDERLPRRLEVVFREREIGGTIYAFQSVGGINVGDRLTDNSVGGDDYRFHDVFHLSFAAILGWSPVLRALLKVKRKSVGAVDEQQDGARAIITEEGIANWIFAHGLRHNAFERVDSLDFALLKTVRAMVQGYEVEDRPLWMWEEAVLRGFAIFRELKRHRGGVVTIDLLARTIEYREPDPASPAVDAAPMRAASDAENP
jgi:NTP pyrophosphatase (non-canonical NTP hydrolase)